MANSTYCFMGVISFNIAEAPLLGRSVKAPEAETTTPEKTQAPEAKTKKNKKAL